MYCAWYGLGRAFIEGLRMDSLYLGSFRVNQLLASALCVFATTILLVLHLRKYRPQLYADRIAAQQEEALEQEIEEEIEEAE